MSKYRNFLAGLIPIVTDGFNSGVLSGIFGNKPDPNDWKGWDELDRSIGAPSGDSPSYWVLNDGDSVQNEAANIVSYIKNKPNGLQNMLNSNWGKTKNPDLFLQLLYDKLQRGGYADAAALIQASLNNTSEPNSNIGNTGSGFVAGGFNPNSGSGLVGNVKKTPPAPDVKKPNYLLIGGIALGSILVLGTVIYLVVRKK